MTAVETLSSIIAQGGKASKAFYQHRVGFDLLTGSEFVSCRGVVQSISCEECNDPHDAHVVFANGSYGIYCPDAGFARLTAQSIEAIQPDIGRLVADLAGVFDCKRRKSTPVHGETWRIGAIDTPVGDLVLYFHPSLQTEQDVRAVEAALLHEVGAMFRLIITAVGTVSVLSAKTVRLADIVEIVSGTGKLATFTDPRAIAGAPKVPSNGRPSPYADKLSLLILQRIEGGTALTGLNEEARAIRKLFGAKYPIEAVPSTSTVKRKVNDLRASS